MKFEKIIKFLKDLIAPKKCIFCSVEWKFLCDKCKEKVEKYSPFCFICGDNNEKYKIHKECKKKENFLLDRVIIFTKYKNKKIAKLIKNAKYYSKKDIFEDFWEILAELLEKNINIKNDNIILTFAPMHKKKQYRRWYNQAEILARHIWKKLNIEVVELVTKIANTRAQVDSSPEERKNNLNKAFEINKKYVQCMDGKKIVIVDDVVTTWSTLNEISKHIIKGKPDEIIGLAIASH